MKIKNAIKRRKRIKNLKIERNLCLEKMKEHMKDEDDTVFKLWAQAEIVALKKLIDEYQNK